MKINFFASLRTLYPLICLLFFSCARIPYLDDRQPSDLIFQKKVYGGVTAMVGTELSAPSFSLYADGTAIYYQYIEGKRKLASSRSSKPDFLVMYNWIEKNLSIEYEKPSKQDGSVITEFFFNSKTIIVEGLGFIQGSSLLDTLHEFSKQVDQLKFKNSKKYNAKQIILYVKRLNVGESRSWPEWKISAVRLDSVYRRDISFYEPNVNENSIILQGKIAEKVQKAIEQTSIYQKFSFNGQIYAVGYKPVLP